MRIWKIRVHATFHDVESSTSLSQTLTKLQDAVSALTKFFELKPDHRFGCILDRQACTPTFATFQAISLPLGPTLSKPNDGVSLSSSFFEFKI